MFFQSLGSLFMINGGRSRAINAENPFGEKGKGGMTSSSLGPGRKGSPCIRLKAGECATIAQITGPGMLQHIWFTVNDHSEVDHFVLRDLVLRVYWDDEPNPSVECPLGDFFCCGFGVSCLVNSMPIAVNPTRGFNCYFPMPFYKSARIIIENQHPVDIEAFFFQVDYCLYDELPDHAGYFHAQWRRKPITEKGTDYVILDDVQGSGRYVGTYFALSTLERFWWGEGEVKFYLDGDKEYPTICGTGTEDYFGGAWSFAIQKDNNTVEENYCTPFMGYPFLSLHDAAAKSPYYMDDCPPMRGMYRFHIMDPICFQSDIRVTIQQLGASHKGLFDRQDDVSTTAYWYQSSPKGFTRPFPARKDRLPR